MKIYRMAALLIIAVAAGILAGYLTGKTYVLRNLDSERSNSAMPEEQSIKDREALEKTSEGIRDGFARGDVAVILAYHHPDVVKALSFEKTINGRDALAADLAATLQQVNLEWIENRVESIWIHSDTAVEQTVFVIRGTPKNGGASFLFKGRAQVVYVRYEQSPTGWASVRELVQPAN
jgi:ketosteroid isomerase-like protein